MKAPYANVDRPLHNDNQVIPSVCIFLHHVTEIYFSMLVISISTSFESQFLCYPFFLIYLEGKSV
jgi:hypothetical protein